MPNPADDLKDALKGAFTDALASVVVTPEDRSLLVQYAGGVAAAAVKAKVAGDAERPALLKEMQGYEDAISLVVARYEVKAGAAAEKALLRAIGAVTKIVVAALA